MSNLSSLCVTLSGAKGLVGGVEMLRCAQHDKVALYDRVLFLMAFPPSPLKQRVSVS